MNATHFIFQKSWYISEEIGYIFCMYTLLTQLFISRFWHSDDYYDHYDDCDYDYSGNEYDFVYILLSSCSSHVTCFQEWCCDKCAMIFNFEGNYKYHVKHCSGVNRYKCDKHGSVYQSKKNLGQHRTKQHGNDVCCLTFFCVENLHYMNFPHILWRCAVEIFHNNLHSNVLYCREWEMRVITVWQWVVNHFLMKRQKMTR